MINNLEDRLQRQKLHLNMVVHELRNPAESIQEGLKQALDLLVETADNLFQEAVNFYKNQLETK
jgi:hypothetical protein